jgi:hypothetical protein
MNQFRIHDFYIIGLIFKAHINLVRFWEKFKVSEILCVTTFDTMCSLGLTQSVYIVPWKRLQNAINIEI